MQGEEAVPERPATVELVPVVERESVIGPFAAEIPAAMLAPREQAVAEGSVGEEPSQRRVGGVSVAVVAGREGDRVEQLVQGRVGGDIASAVGDLVGAIVAPIDVRQIQNPHAIDAATGLSELGFRQQLGRIASQQHGRELRAALPSPPVRAPLQHRVRIGLGRGAVGALLGGRRRSKQGDQRRGGEPWQDRSSPHHPRGANRRGQ